MEQVFEEWNAYSLKKELKQRETVLEEMLANAKLKIIAITGVRRAGKSSLLMLLHQKTAKDAAKTAFVNLEDSRIKSNPKILDDTLKWFGDDGYLFLDEITSVNDWEGWLARNHEMLKGKLNIIVSSSRKTLSQPNKPLRGRVLSFELFPLSFKEFLEFKKIKAEKTTAGIGVVEKALNEYLVFGGFPEIVLTENKTDKIRLLNTYFNDIIGLDVAEISREEISTVEHFGKYAIEATMFSASKCLNFFKTIGHKIGKQSILNLEKNSQGSYLFFFVPIFSNKIKDRLQYPRKVYPVDTGFINSISGKMDMGKLFEIAVFLELKRRSSQTQEISYWKNAQGIEADFLIREGTKTKKIIQVAYELKEEKTNQREIKGIVECAKEMKLKEGTIITKETEKKEKNNGITINYIPLWKWLLKK